MHNKLMYAVMLAGLMALGACGPEVAASGDVRRGPADGEAVELTMVDNEFDPETIEAPTGEQVTIQVANDGNSEHNLVIDELDVSTGTLKSGEVATVTLQMPDSETEFVCTFHGGMNGRLMPEPG